MIEKDKEAEDAVRELQALAGVKVDEDVEELDLFGASDNRQGRGAIRGMLTILTNHIRDAEGYLISVGFEESLRIGTPAELKSQRWWLLGDYERTGRKLALDMDELWYQSVTYADQNDLVALEVFNERFFEQRWHRQGLVHANKSHAKVVAARDDPRSLMAACEEERTRQQGRQHI